LAKLLPGMTQPWLLAGLFYLGAGLGLGLQLRAPNGIDAPKMRGGNAGRGSRTALEKLVANKPVSCEILKRREIEQWSTGASAGMGSAARRRR
jgi:hypothetical protein